MIQRDPNYAMRFRTMLNYACDTCDVMRVVQNDANLNCFYFLISSATTVQQINSNSLLQITYKSNSSFSITHCGQYEKRFTINKNKNVLKDSCLAKRMRRGKEKT